MKKSREAFVGIDAAKTRNAVTLAESGRQGEMRYLGELDANPDGVAKLVRKLSDRYETLHFCCEAGPTGAGKDKSLGFADIGTLASSWRTERRVGAGRDPTAGTVVTERYHALGGDHLETLLVPGPRT